MTGYFIKYLHLFFLRCFQICFSKNFAAHIQMGRQAVCIFPIKAYHKCPAAITALSAVYLRGNFIVQPVNNTVNIVSVFPFKE